MHFRKLECVNIQTHWLLCCASNDLSWLENVAYRLHVFWYVYMLIRKLVGLMMMTDMRLTCALLCITYKKADTRIKTITRFSNNSSLELRDLGCVYTILWCYCLGTRALHIHRKCDVCIFDVLTCLSHHHYTYTRGHYMWFRVRVVLHALHAVNNVIAYTQVHHIMFMRISRLVAIWWWLSSVASALYCAKWECIIL